MEIASAVRSEDATVPGRIGAVREAAEFFFAYDAANRMVSAVKNGVTTLASFDVACPPAARRADRGDNLGRPAAIRYAGSAANDVSLSWSGEGDLLTLAHALSGTAYDVSFTGTYTPAHQIASSGVSNGLYQYVPQATGTDAYAPDALNRYASITPAGGTAATAIGYDLKGNLTSDGTFAFAYDAENKLMTAAKTGTAAAYAYDPLGRRDRKIVNGVATYFLSADTEEIAEYDGAGTLLRRYVPGPGTDRPIAMVDVTGGTPVKTFFHQDKTGSVIAMSDSAGNRTEGPYLYDSFGNGAPYTGVPFKYTGRRLDPETGLYYYRARYYCARCGRFLQTDAIGYADDINWYAYVGNDPTDKTDPSGNCPECVGAIIGGAIELGFQLSDPNVRADYVRAGGDLTRGFNQLASGDFKGALASGSSAVNAAGSHVADVAISAGAGALGSFGTSRAATLAVDVAKSAGVTSQAGTVAAKIAGASGFQAANSAAARVESNAANGRDLGNGVGAAVAAGAVVGGPLSVAGRAVEGAVPAGAGRFATQVTTKLATGVAKKEGVCEMKSGKTCP